LENYVKAVLHAYPFLKMEKEAYVQHVKNKALLSCDGRVNTEKLVEHLAEEILHKRRLEWLEEVLEQALSSLGEPERGLVGIRFFGEKRSLEGIWQAVEERYKTKTMGRRRRMRFWEQTLDKLDLALRKAGVTQKCFDEELLDLAIVKRIYKRVRFCSQRKLSYGNET
jgi:hypothetical protein